ncbi:SdrD B-like domain-containing protein [Accumulibacter sp.]|uniref:DUF7507 domain-containing protein n=1 Tax=Accumulibacter sp. TaxID=2053492 RepID=UPI0025E655AE|nr:SdrD B-like domain-containing protein [Accumulibacter sp.]MCM8640114.1 carboxypeptidase regulatory-like domain-containing protein [Accumulibacter sp.]
MAQNPSLNIVKNASVPGGSANVAGEVISYTIAVQNTGNQTLTGVTVSDPFISNLTRVADTVGDNDNLLEVGETWAYTASHTVTQAEIDAGGNIVNVATADSNETGPDTDDASIPVAQNPSLNIVKNASVPGGSANVAGEVISYTIAVQNTGNQTLTGVTVSDPFISNLTRVADTVGDNDNLLEVGETWAYTASHTVTQAEIDAGGSIVNTATADSNETGPDTDGASIPVEQRPGLNIVKTAVPGQIVDTVGELITYDITVANTGNQTLTGIVVTDAMADAGIVRNADLVGDNDSNLDVGETWSYTAQHTVTQAEIDSNGGGDGYLDNTAFADSDQTPPDSDSAAVPIVQTGSIGDLVWEDLNFNGLRDAGEPGIAGVTVKLRDSSGVVVASDTTNGNGFYLFDRVGPGNYQVEVLAPTGFFFTRPDQGGDDGVDSDVGTTGATGSGLSGPITLLAGQSNLTIDAGLYQKATLGDQVWLDRDKDGIQDTNEIGVGNVVVRVQDYTSGAFVASTTTNAAGTFLFSDLDPGSYRLVFDKAGALTGAISVAKYPWAQQDAGNDDGLDSDVQKDPTDGNLAFTTARIVLSSGQTDRSWDAAITPLAIDLNGDGIRTISRADSLGSFDLLGTGVAIKSGWLSAEDGFLVVDGNGNGVIDDVSEMFGGLNKGDGFAALAAFDSNGDGVVDSSDARFDEIQIWRDANGNHLTDEGELITLADAGLISLTVGHTELPFLDAQGNLHLERSSAVRTDGTTVDMTDVYFAVAASDAAAGGAALPSIAQLMGYDLGAAGSRSDAFVDTAVAGLQNDMDLPSVQLVGMAIDPSLVL